MKRIIASPELAIKIKELKSYPSVPFNFEDETGLVDRNKLISEILNLLPPNMPGFKYDGKLYFKPLILDEVPELEDFDLPKPTKRKKHGSRSS